MHFVHVLLTGGKLRRLFICFFWEIEESVNVFVVGIGEVCSCFCSGK